MFNPCSKRTPSPALTPTKEELAQRGLERFLPERVPLLLRFSERPISRKNDIIPKRRDTPRPEDTDVMQFMAERITIRQVLVEGPHFKKPKVERPASRLPV